MLLMVSRILRFMVWFSFAFRCTYYIILEGLCQALLLLTFVVATCAIIPTRGRRLGVGGSVTAIAIGIVAGGIVGTGGRVEAVNILGAVGGVAIACGTIAIHHCCLPLSHFVVLIIAPLCPLVNPFLKKTFFYFFSKTY